MEVTMKAQQVEMEEYELEKQYIEMLDDCYGDIDICGIPYQASMALKEVDPTAFRCGMIDYEDSLDHQYKCSKCDKIFNTEDEAEECCQVETEDN
jgi:hypothetical protein